jgi:citrate lyase beta subunit
MEIQDLVRLRGAGPRRSYIEIPTMDDRKWAKIPSISADVFLIDMEDTVPPALKEAARHKVASAVAEATYFGGREVVCRVNNLSTTWGLDDLRALGEAGAARIVYPKARSGAELREVRDILDRYSPAPEIIAIIETPQAVLRLEELSAVSGITGLLFGPGDLALETGTSMFVKGASFDQGFLYAKSKMLLAARAFGLEAIEPVLLADLKNLEDVRHAVEVSRLFGFDANLTFYPPHVDVINAVRTPTAEETEWNRRVVEAYELALEVGQAAVMLDAQWLTVHQYAKAQRELRHAPSDLNAPVTQ